MTVRADFLPYKMGILPYKMGILPYKMGILPYKMGKAKIKSFNCNELWNDFPLQILHILQNVIGISPYA
jgi:hypothetical protein